MNAPIANQDAMPGSLERLVRRPKTWFVENRIGWWLLFIVTLPFAWITPIGEWNSKAFEHI